MNRKAIERMLAEAKQQARITENISVQMCWCDKWEGLRWCVVQMFPCRIPTWQFWRVRFNTVQMYGAFPSYNQAMKFARYLANPV